MKIIVTRLRMLKGLGWRAEVFTDKDKALPNQPPLGIGKTIKETVGSLLIGLHDRKEEYKDLIDIPEIRLVGRTKR